MIRSGLIPAGDVRRIDRRRVLLGSAALALPPFGTRRARAEGAIAAVMPGPLIPDGVRPLLEKKAGTRVENAPYVSPTDTLAKLMAPGGTAQYDLMVSTTPFVRDPILGARSGEEKVAPIDVSLIPNAGKIMDLFKPDIVTRDGVTYMVPVIWGYDSVIYNADRIPSDDPLTQSWGVLFDDRYAGRVAWRDDAQMTIMAASLHLGIADPATMSASDLKEAAAFLISKKKNVRTLWSTFGAAVNLMASGEVWAMYGWIPMRAALQKRGMNVTNNWPAESLLVWSQGAFIPRNSRNAKASHAVINAYLDAEVGKTLIAETKYPTTSNEVSGAFSPEERRKLGLDVTERNIKLYPLKFPPAMDQWLEAWNTVKAA